MIGHEESSQLDVEPAKYPRLHMRRLTRLTLAFSKKRENFEAAGALHFAY